MFFRKRTLIEHDPKTLSLEMLSTLQASLIAKLILVNDELERRYRNLVSLSADLPNSPDSRKVLAEGADRLDGFNTMLHAELARMRKFDNQISN